MFFMTYIGQIRVVFFELLERYCCIVWYGMNWHVWKDASKSFSLDSLWPEWDGENMMRRRAHACMGLSLFAFSSAAVQRDQRKPKETRGTKKYLHLSLSLCLL
jgi:hypothetical protein